METKLKPFYSKYVFLYTLIVISLKVNKFKISCF